MVEQTRCLTRLTWIDLHGQPVTDQPADDPLSWPRFYRCSTCGRTEYHPARVYRGTPRCGAGRTPSEQSIPEPPAR